jgi:hypothetical protein
MKVLVKFVEAISDHYQGGSGKIFDRQTIMELDDGMALSSVMEVVEMRLRDTRPVTYDVSDKQLIRLNSVEVFK